MNRENKILSATLVAMVMAVIWLMNSRANSDSAPDPSLFQVENQAEIDQVVLVSRADTVALAFSGSRWQLNNTFGADRRMIKVLFATLDQVRPLREATGAEADSARKWVSHSGTTITLSKQGERVFGFGAGGNPAKTVAYFIHPSGAVFAMHIPGYRVYASGVFETDADSWREKRLFDFNWQNFKSLTCKTSAGAGDFEIVYTGKGFGFAGTDTDTARINAYLDDVSLMGADSFYKRGNSDLLDSILRTQPKFEILVRDVGSRSFRLEVFAARPADRLVLARLNGEPLLLSRDNATLLARTRRYFLAVQAHQRDVTPPTIQRF